MAALIIKILAIYFFCIFSFLNPSSEAKIPFCNQNITTFLPPPYRNQTSFKCSPAWGSIVFKFFQDDDNATTIILSSESTSGWIGIGFSKDGEMIGSSTVVGWLGKEGGASGIKKYFLEGKSTESVLPNKGELQFTDISPFVTYHNGSFYMGFQINFASQLHQQYIILALGDGNPIQNQLPMHIDQTVMKVDFFSGHAAIIVDNIGDLKRSHGLIGLIGWGAILPIGAIIARYFKHHDPQWFYLHLSIQSIGFLFGFAGVAAGWSLYDKLNSDFKIHRGIGVLVFFLSILQVMALSFRPDKASKWRKYWNWYHHWFGRLALFLGSLNIVIGVHIGGAGIVWKIGYGLILVVILVTITILEICLLLGRFKKGYASPV